MKYRARLWDATYSDGIRHQISKRLEEYHPSIEANLYTLLNGIGSLADTRQDRSAPHYLRAREDEDPAHKYLDDAIKAVSAYVELAQYELAMMRSGAGGAMSTPLCMASAMHRIRESLDAVRVRADGDDWGQRLKDLRAFEGSLQIVQNKSAGWVAAQIGEWEDIQNGTAASPAYECPAWALRWVGPEGLVLLNKLPEGYSDNFPDGYRLACRVGDAWEAAADGLLDFVSGVGSDHGGEAESPPLAEIDEIGQAILKAMRGLGRAATAAEIRRKTTYGRNAVEGRLNVMLLDAGLVKKKDSKWVLTELGDRATGHIRREHRGQ